MSRRLVLLALMSVAAHPRLAAAGTYYVSAAGTAGGAGTQVDPWSLGHANTTAKAGDTIILLDGSYTTSIAPSQSGTAGMPITYRAAAAHQARFSGWTSSSPAVLLTGRSYIVVDGIESVNVARWVLAEGGQHHITIRDCNFKQSSGWESARFRGSVSHITVSGCRFDGGTDSLHIRDGENHLVENNTFVDASHTCLVLMGVHRSVVRHNTLPNAMQEKCMEVFSMRGVYGPPRKSELNVIEDNRFGPCDLSCSATT